MTINKIILSRKITKTEKMEFNMKNEMTKNIFTNVFLFMNLNDILTMTKINRFFRSILINDNNRWYSVCFNKIYNFVLYNVYKKQKQNVYMVC